jgi:hypothetical protein
MTEPLTADAFVPYVGGTFRVRGAAHTIALERIDRRELEPWEAAALARAPFNLIFRGPPDNLLAAGLYTFDVDDAASFDLYVMPVHTPSPDRQEYQAAFN